MNSDVEDRQDPTQNLPEKKPHFSAFLEKSPNQLISGLYLVATPIGNIRDITLRALDVLSDADVIACEDTRQTGKLLSLLGLKKKLIPYHEHNADEQRPKIIDRIRRGERVALVSDAGMPLISDPGYKLVRSCYEANIYVTSLPGANAPLTAMQLSGLPSDHFAFLGFLPSKTKARKDILKKWQSVEASLIIFESANRMEDSLQDCLECLGDRQMALTRELTKKFEEVWRGTISEILRRLKEEGAPKGEIVLVIDRGAEIRREDIDLDALLTKALATCPFKEAVAAIVDQTRLPKKAIYNRALELKNQI